MKLTLPPLSLLAVDPGNTSGVVEIVNGKLMTAYTLTYEEIRDAVALGCIPMCTWRQYHTWVVEDFRTYPWVSTAGFNPVLPARLLGMLEVAATHNRTKMVYQMAGTVKPVVTDEKLQALGWLPLLRNKHVRDAARHAAYYLLRQPPHP